MEIVSENLEKNPGKFALQNLDHISSDTITKFNMKYLKSKNYSFYNNS